VFVHRTGGNIVYQTRDFGADEITPDQRVIHRVRLDREQIHHDLTEMPDGRIMFIGAEERRIDGTSIGGPRDWAVRGDTLNIVDMASGSAKVVWSAFEALDPLARVPKWQGRKVDGADDWTHANTVSLGPRGNVLVTFRYLDQIVSLSPDLQRVEWKLGGPGSTFRIPEAADRFYGPHTASELADNHVLLFDNGNLRPEGEWSRAVEYQLDSTTMTARKVWEFRPQPDLFSGSQSNAVRLPNGNTLINWGDVQSGAKPPPGSYRSVRIAIVLSAIVPIRSTALPASSQSSRAPSLPTERHSLGTAQPARPDAAPPFDSALEFLHVRDVLV
jgi:hypothetical protein